MTNNVNHRNLKQFFKSKNIEISVKRYFIDSLSFMSLGLFSSLLIGTIFNTIGETFNVSLFTDTISPLAKQVTGPAIAVAIAYGLQAPPLVMFSTVLVGACGYELGGPVATFISTVFAVECGKLISKETRLDILITPALSILIGVIVATLIGPVISNLMNYLGLIIMKSTDMHPILMGSAVACIVGITLTLPISSAAICIMLDLGGIAGGAATVGCCCQMIGFASMSYEENGFEGFIAQGLGTSMLQIPNIINNWRIWIPPTVSSIILGPISTVVFKLENIPIGSGMGTSGLVGQFGTFSAMQSVGYSHIYIITAIFLLQIFLPATISLIISRYMKRKNYIKRGDLKLHL